MENRQLRYFLAVVETGTLAAAAQQLHVTDSAISRAIQQLEHVIGSPLFERTPRGMAPTICGFVLARHARHVRAETNRTIGELRELGGKGGGTVVVGSTPSFASVLLPRAVSAFQHGHVRARIKVHEGLLDY